MIEGPLDQVLVNDLRAGRTNHCSSICPHRDGVLICWYSGKHECHDKQSVYVTYYDGEYTDPIRIGDTTGNPVIWQEDENKAIILYSKFENMDTNNIVSRWMHCSNWLKEIKYVGDGIFETGDEVKLETDPEIGLLGRCQPIKFNGKWLLPMYREHDCYGEIFEGNGLEFKSIGKIGVTSEETGTRFGKGILIQPTIWHHGGIIYSLSRDISRNRKAWFSKSEDGGKTWSEPEISHITNHNNSLVALHDNKNTTNEPMVIWNHSDGKLNRTHRHRLLLGQIKMNDKVRAIGLLDKKQGINSMVKLNDREPASYPNYCFDDRGNLHVIHTDSPSIKHHIFKVPQL